MTGILELPLELRSRILELAICTPQGHTHLKSDLTVWDSTGRCNIPTSVSGAWADEETSSRVWFQIQPSFSTLASLRCVNRQFYADVKYALCHNVSSRPDYSLDIVYRKDVTLWPTWRCVPVLQRHIGTLHATFRIAQCPQEVETTNKNQKMYRGGDGGPAPIVWSFFHLLKVFLQYGPWPLPDLTDKDSSPRISIRNLVIDCVSAEPDEPVGRYPSFSSSSTVAASYYSQHPDISFFGWASSIRPDTYRTKDEALLESTQLANFVKSYMSTLVSVDYYTFHYGRFLYESVGSIEIKLQGTTPARMDLSQYPYREDFGTFSREEMGKEYATWIVSTTHTRKELGLPVGPLDARFRGFLAEHGISESVINNTLS